MKASICIATHQKPTYLKKTLDSIFCQLPGFPFEVIVVMDGSDDSTKEVCSRYKDNPLKTAWIDNTTYRNPGFARNLAARMASGEILIHQSDDVVHADMSTIKNLIEATTPNNFVIATVWNVDFNTGHKLEQYTGFQSQRGLFFLGSLTRENFYKAGGNCEEFTEPGWEDNWLELSLTKGLGLQRVFTEDITGYHLHHERPHIDHFNSRMRKLFLEKTAYAEASGNLEDYLGSKEPWTL